MALISPSWFAYPLVTSIRQEKLSSTYLSPFIAPITLLGRQGYDEWSAKDKAQKARLVEILNEMITQLKSEGVASEQNDKGIPRPVAKKRKIKRHSSNKAQRIYQLQVIPSNYYHCDLIRGNVLASYIILVIFLTL